MKTYIVTVTAQYGGSYETEQFATTAAMAIKRARDENRNEMYFDRMNNGRITYKARVA